MGRSIPQKIFQVFLLYVFVCEFHSELNLKMVKGVAKAMSVVIIATVVMAMAGAAARAQKVPCYFVFGDSFSDSGNNNNLLNQIRVNYLPYGIDFPKGPTGRYTNGRTIPDFLAEFMGFTDYIPPFAEISQTQVSSGVNYASGGSGILDESGKQAGDNIEFNRQIQNHLTAITWASVPKQRLNQCLYTVYIGTNDYLNNYFMSPPFQSGLLFTPDEFADILIARYASHLKVLYVLGARKVALFGLSKLGCIPTRVATRGGCDEDVNAAVELFNSRLRALVDDLNQSLVGAKFTYVDMFNTPIPASLGLRNESCCTTQPPQGLCVPNQPVLEDRSKCAYWDGVHDTEIVNLVVAESAFTGQTASPYSIATLTGQTASPYSI
ncbi:PREDICTED: GDSL esterase/lipase At4g30140-like [Tarenaya hassleriana]|uniref:GDSL esterase/lipase At4g30140-like n=1 Tax=Tarenaya hassleriana TaxID=28532 RepID=UPI00053C9CC8|nr:PREDICTED: GDSL esterase/lipase At4g30140-like [Tarenaya hassleriana]